MFSQMNEAMRNCFGELQQKTLALEGDKTLAKQMSAMHDEIQRLLDLEEKRRANDERLVSNDRLRDDRIANGRRKLYGSKSIIASKTI